MKKIITLLLFNFIIFSAYAENVIGIINSSDSVIGAKVTEPPNSSSGTQVKPDAMDKLTTPGINPYQVSVCWINDFRDKRCICGSQVYCDGPSPMIVRAVGKKVKCVPGELQIQCIYK